MIVIRYEPVPYYRGEERIRYPEIPFTGSIILFIPAAPR
jgi:hypothetical protein